METSITTKELLDRYYERLSGKCDINSLLSENFLLTGTVDKETRGKEAYAGNVFFTLVKSLKIKTMIIDGERACAVVNYELASPKGDRFSCDVAELWEIKGGKLDSLAVYFDTVAYQKFMLPILFPLSRLKRKK
jgi:ketosteroid isomerase-like protein